MKRTELVQELDNAGLTNDYGKGLARRVPSRGWLKIVNVTLEGNYLVYGVSGLDDPIVECGPSGTDLLHAFLKFAEKDAAPAQIADFAQRYGVLELCEHHLPRTHWDRLMPDPDAITWPACAFLSCPGKFGYSQEPIEDWKNLARGLSAVLRVAADLHQNRPAPLAIWKDIFSMGTGAKHSFTHIERCEGLSPTVRITSHRWLLNKVINWLIQVANVRPWFWWSDTGTGIEFGGPEVSGLFGHLILQLVLVVSQKEAFAFCTACGREYLITRQPAQNRNNYCLICRNAGVPQRGASLRYWRKTGRRKREKEQSKRKNLSRGRGTEK